MIMLIYFDHTIISNDNGWNYGGFGIEMEEPVEKIIANFKESLENRLPNAPMSLEICDVGLKFQL